MMSPFLACLSTEGDVELFQYLAGWKELLRCVISLPKAVFQRIGCSFSSHLHLSSTKQVPNPAWLFSPSPPVRSRCPPARLACRAQKLCTTRPWLLWRRGSGKQGAPGPSLGRECSNAAFAAPHTALVPTQPPQSGDRDARRSGRGRAMRGRLQHRAGRAPPMAHPPGFPPGHPRPPESRLLAPASVSRNQRGGRAGGPGPGRPSTGGRLQPNPEPADPPRPAPAGLMTAV